MKLFETSDAALSPGLPDAFSSELQRDRAGQHPGFFCALHSAGGSSSAEVFATRKPE
jgi:hypothetical protein